MLDKALKYAREYPERVAAGVLCTGFVAVVFGVDVVLFIGVGGAICGYGWYKKHVDK